MRAPIHNYTKEQVEFVRDNIKGTSYKEMREMFNKRFETNLTFSQINGFIKRNNFKNGNDARFEKGQETWNKGMKGLRFEGSEKGWFRKGQDPINHRPVGSERICTKDGYTLVKVAEPNVWKLKQRIVWEEAHGEVPENHVVLFGDGDKQNFDLDNLILVSRSQLARLNQQNLIQNDADLTRVALNIITLQGAVRAREHA